MSKVGSVCDGRAVHGLTVVVDLTLNDGSGLGFVEELTASDLSIEILVPSTAGTRRSRGSASCLGRGSSATAT